MVDGLQSCGSGIGGRMGRYGVGMVCMLSGGGMSEAMIDRCGKAPGAGSHSLRWTSKM